LQSLILWNITLLPTWPTEGGREGYIVIKTSNCS